MRSIVGRLTQELSNHTTSKNVALDPGLKIFTFRKLVEQIAKLSYLNKDYLLFFRGQKNDFRNSNEKSTFYPTIYRSDYLKQEELDFRFEKLQSASRILTSLFKENKIEGYTEIERKKYIQWSILQHYEVAETPLIDVTQSIRVACSFAQLDNEKENAFIYVFALPYFTNRISINSEHDLVNIRLLSISPPQALRPFFQEGYLVGTDEITNDYVNKSELDLNNRLIAKYEIPNINNFWGSDFAQIPRDALYPNDDLVKDICDQIGENIETESSSINIGKYLKLWAEIEQVIMSRSKNIDSNIHSIRDAINSIYRLDDNKQQVYKI